MPLPKQTPVLVVGAGPNGLVAAITLTHLGHKVTIIDALPERKLGARGALIHARTLEVLKTVNADLVSALTHSEYAIRSKGVVFHDDQQALLNADVAGLADETEFPFVLLMSQEKAERIMQDHLSALGVEVIPNTRVVGFGQDPTGHGIRVDLEDGSSVSTFYVIGADGARSTIRTLAGIGFKDPFSLAPYDEDVDSSKFVQITLADLYLKEGMSNAIPRDSVSWHMNGRLMFCPIEPPKDEADDTLGTYWRIAIIIPIGSKKVPPRHPSIEFLQEEIRTRKPWPEDLVITKLVTSATYRVRSAVADTFFTQLYGGNICLVGDAAHVHSPTGGQGMNLGICDAVRLSQAIDKHMSQVEGKSPSNEVLLEYSKTRRENAIQVIRATKYLTTVLNAPDGWKVVARNVLLRVAGYVPFIQRKAAWRLSGLAYRD